MGFWSDLASRLSRKSGGIDSSLALFREVYGSRMSKSGATVTLETALRVSTVLACCRVIAEGIAQVPWRLHQETSKGSKQATDHSLYRVVNRRPNGWQTSFEMREMLVFHVLLAGNAYGFLNRVGMDRRVVEIIPLTPDRVRAEQQPDWTMRYWTRGRDGQEKEIPAELIWHIRGASWNGAVGMDVLRLAQEAIGLAISTEGSQSAFHANGAKVSGTYSIEGPLTPEQHKALKSYITDEFTGALGDFKAMILDRGAKWTPLQMSGVDAQHLETRKFQVEDVCRVFRVMPIMVGYSDKTATYASAEQMFLAHVTHTLMPWFTRIEQSADVNLLSEKDQAAGFYTKFNANALMRGAAKDRAEYYAKALGAGGGKGWMKQNEVRALEELDRDDDPAADELPQPIAAATAAPPPPNDNPTD